MAAFRRAVAVGADAIELDVRLSRDGVPWSSTTRRSIAPPRRRGPVSARTADELAALKVGNTTGVPTAGEVLREIALPILLEVKEPGAQEAVAGVLLRMEAADRVVVASAHDEALDAFRQVAVPGGRLGAGHPAPVACAAAGAARTAVRRLQRALRHRGVLPVPTRRFVAMRMRSGRACMCGQWMSRPGAPALEARRERIVTNQPGRLVAARGA